MRYIGGALYTYPTVYILYINLKKIFEKSKFRLKIGFEVTSFGYQLVIIARVEPPDSILHANFQARSIQLPVGQEMSVRKFTSTRKLTFQCMK